MNLEGRKFGRLTVVGRADRGSQGLRWHCVCECGGATTTYAVKLTSGHTKSCGCLRLEAVRAMGKKNRKHGMAKTVVYGVWRHMRARCEVPDDKDFCNYGARGITVCQRWQEFENFYADMGPRPRGATIERRDNDRGYEPGNCVWATVLQQNRNRRNVRRITVDGKTMTAPEWSEQTGLLPDTIGARIRAGWSPEAAVVTPLMHPGYGGRPR